MIDKVWRCTVCGFEKPFPGFDKISAVLLRCPECGLTRHVPVWYVYREEGGRGEWRPVTDKP